MTSFGGEVKSLAPCSKILQHVKNPCGVRDISPAKLRDIYVQVFPCISTRCLLVCHRALVDESGKIRTQIGTHDRSENGRNAWDALCDTTP
jgi:hypothetical protein